MDAVEYLKSVYKMCDIESKRSCACCPLSKTWNYKGVNCSQHIRKYPEETVAKVEKWWEQNKPLEFTDEQIEALKALAVLRFRYMARDDGDSLYLYKFKPRKRLTTWEANGAHIGAALLPNFPDFPQISWEDAEPFDIKAYLETLKK